MMNKRDIIYCAYKYDGYKPLKLKWKVYCFLRKIITIESPSLFIMYSIDKYEIKE